jgi:hypothetical protein
VRSRDDLVADALKTSTDEYVHLFTRFTVLDTKAQGTATVAGAMLAATMAFLPHDTFEKRIVGLYGSAAAAAVGVVVSLAVAAVVLAYLSLEVRAGRAPSAATWSWSGSKTFWPCPMGVLRKSTCACTISSSSTPGRRCSTTFRR